MDRNPAQDSTSGLKQVFSQIGNTALCFPSTVEGEKENPEVRAVTSMSKSLRNSSLLLEIDIATNQ